MYTQQLTQAEIDAIVAVRPPHWASIRLTMLAMQLQNPLWTEQLLNWFTTHVLQCSCWRCEGLKQNKAAEAFLGNGVVRFTTQDFYLRYLSDILYTNSQVMLN